MDYIEVDQERCNACGKCVKTCPFNAIRIKNKEVIIDLNLCTLCNTCVNSCKRGAIKIIKFGRKSVSSKYKGILVVVEYFNRELKNINLQLISKAVELSKASGDEVTVLLIGNRAGNAKKLKSIFSEYGIKKIGLIYNKNLNQFITEDFSEIISKEILDTNPKIVLFLGTIFGRSIAPRIATRIKTGLTADCTDLQIDKKGNLLQIRPTYGGKVLATIKSPYNFPQMASVRPNIFIEKKRPLKTKDINLTIREMDIESNTSLREVKKIISLIKNTDEHGAPLDEAKIVFCAGLGVSSKEGFERLRSFAERNGIAIAATRKIIDNKWADFSKQIGQTGLTIRPELYVGFGVSGAIHHIIGMRHSRKIVAINKDLRAPIFKIADYCIVADLFEVLDELESKF